MTATGRAWNAHAVLALDEMRAVDAAAIAGGTPGIALMESAAAAVAREIRRRWAPRPTLVLCGPGNNGGDGFGVAVELRAARWPVTVALLGEVERLKGDAATLAARWQGPIAPLDPGLVDSHALVVDALFGAGLARALEGEARAVVEALLARPRATVAIDVPSGLDGGTGEVLGVAAPAAVTVTFFRPKPGHLLMPGRALCGDLVVADIGIPDSVLDGIAPKTARNHAGLWRERFPWPAVDGHKYRRGHAVVAGGETTTGAARLAARAALGIGAGLVTVAAPAAAFAVYASSLVSVMVAPVADGGDFDALLADERKNAVLLGPGNGVTKTTRARALATLAAGKRTVLDADALTVFADDPETLFGAVAGVPCVLTPHDGEYARIFEHRGDRLARTRAGAATAGAVVLLKGPETVIAAPDGRAAIAGGPPTLATAGTGDVLSGLIVGLLAQGVDAFDAACMAAWVHGRAADAAGPGLVSERLADRLPAVLACLAPRA